MKLSNFELVETKGRNALDWEYFAEVDVETGHFFWKTLERRRIRREFVGFWHFVDTGELTPDRQAEILARAWKAQTGQAV